MAKSSVKKVVIFMLMAIGVIACFAAMPNIINQRSNIVQEEILDLGLDYKDGWYLINNEDDYYTMQHNWGNGIGADANYRLTTDLTISAKKSNELRATETGARVFGGNFNGGSHTVEVGFDVEEEPEIFAGRKATITLLDSNNTEVTVYGILNDVAWGNIEEINYSLPSNINFNIETDDANRCAFGIIAGYADNVTFKNCRVDFNGYSVYANVGKDRMASMGGIVGVASRCRFENCIVKGVDLQLEGMEATHIGGDVAIVPNCYTGALVGWAYDATRFDGCLAIDIERLEATDFSIFMSPIFYGLGTGGDFGFDVGDLTQCYDGILYSPEFFTVEGGGIVDVLDNVATTFEEYKNSSTEWVLIPGVNGGEIIQKCFAEIPATQLRIYNVMTSKGVPNEEEYILVNIFKGMTWKEMFELECLQDTDYFKLKKIVNSNDVCPYNDINDVWDGSTDKFDQVAINVYRLNAVWDGVVGLWVYNVLWPEEPKEPVETLANVTYLYPGITWSEIIKEIDGETGALTPSEGYSLVFGGLVNSNGECPYTDVSEEWDGSFEKFDYMHKNNYRLDAVWLNAELRVYNIWSYEDDAPDPEAYSTAQLRSGVTWIEIIDEINKGKGVLFPDSNMVFVEFENSNGECPYVDESELWDGTFDAFDIVEGEENVYRLEAVWKEAIVLNIFNVLVNETPSLDNESVVEFDASQDISVKWSEIIAEADGSSGCLTSNSRYEFKYLSTTIDGGSVYSSVDELWEGDTSGFEKGPKGYILYAVWENISGEYTITLLTEGGSISGYSPSTVDYNSSTKVITYTEDITTIYLPAPSQINKSGYRFTGWEYYSGDSIMVSTSGTSYWVTIATPGNSTVIAKWEELEVSNCTIYLIFNGGSLDSSWKPNSDSGCTKVVHTDTYAELSYSGNGTSILNLPYSGMSRSQYKFDGWKGSGGEFVTSVQSSGYLIAIKPISGTITLNAYWSESTEDPGADYLYSIGLVFNNGQESFDIINNLLWNPPGGVWVTEGTNGTIWFKYNGYDEFYLPTASSGITYFGHTFKGWKLELANGPTVDYTSINGYVTKINGCSGTDGTVSFSLEWQKYEDLYKIRYNANGGTFNRDSLSVSGEFVEISSGHVTELYFGSSGTSLLVSGTVSRVKYNFVGWQYNNDADGELYLVYDSKGYITGVEAGSKANFSVIAVWEVATYTLTLNTDGGSVINYNLEKGDSEDSRLSYDSTKQLIYYSRADAFELPKYEHMRKDGAAFLGWRYEYNYNDTIIFLDANGEKIASPSTYCVSVEAESYGNYSITAIWTEDSYTITLNLSGIDSITAYKPTTVTFDGVNKITYTPDANFYLPTDINVNILGNYMFMGWKIRSQEGIINCVLNAHGYIEQVQERSYGDAVLEPVIEEFFVVNFMLNGGEWNGYNPNGSKIKWENSTVFCAVSASFNLPLATEVKRDGYLIKSWKLILISLDEGMTTSNWREGGEYVPGDECYSGYALELEFEAQWELVEYGIRLVLNEGVLSNYKPSDEISLITSNSYYVDFNYTITSVFSLPNDTQITKPYYTFQYWEFDTLRGDGNWKEGEKFGDTSKITNVADLQEVLISRRYGNIVLKAVWTKTEYTITLDNNGGSIKNYSPGWWISYINNVITYNYDDYEGNAFTLPDSTHMTRSGYRFDYWVITEITMETNWGKVGDIIQSTATSHKKYGSIKVEAHWTLLNYDITFKLMGGTLDKAKFDATGLTLKSETEEYITYVYNTDIPFNIPTVEVIKQIGYNFGGWVIQSAVGSWTPAGAVVSGQQSAKWGNVILIAQWTAIPYYITLNGMGGNISYRPTEVSYVGNVITYYKTSVFSLPTADNVKRDGYTFTKWRISVADEDSLISWGAVGTIIDPEVIVSGKYGSLTLQALWDVNEYTLTLNLNGGNIDKSTYENYSGLTLTKDTDGVYKTVYTIETEIKLPTSAHMYRDGYNFRIWTLSANVNSWGNKNDEFSGNLSGKWGNATLIAQWTPISYTITFILDNAGEIGQGKIVNREDIKNNVLSYDITKTINLPTALQTQKTGYTFEGWKLQNVVGNWGTDGVLYFNPGTSLTEKWGDIILIADWNAISYTLILDTNNGILKNYNQADLTYLNIVGDKVSYQYTIESVFDLPIDIQILRDGYEFASWVIETESNAEHNWGSKGTQFSQGGLLNLSEKYGNIELKADWTIIYYTLIFSLDNDGRIGKGSLSGYDSSIQYTIEDEFNLPTKLQTQRTGYKLVEWELIENDSNGNVWGTKRTTTKKGTTYAPNEKISEKWGNVTLQAIWDLIPYTLTLDTNNGILKNYNQADLTYLNIVGDKVSYQYTIESKFSLPSQTETYKAGYTTTKWELVATTTSWGEGGKKYDSGAEIAEKYSDITLIAVWEENKYTIIMNANNQTGATKTITPVKYTELASLDWEVNYNKHVFVGWAMQGYQSTQTYEYIDTNFTTSNIVLDFGTKILKNGGKVSKLSHGDLNAVATVNVYAIWLPIYNVTIESNGAGIYENGTLTTKQSFTDENHYYKEYLLYSQLEKEIFELPTTIEGMGTYRLHLYGYYISGWIIRADGLQYYVPSKDTNPGYSQWKYTEDVTMLVESGTNLQYLQGDIVAIPQWKALQFDVRFVTKEGEAYKKDYDNEYISSVTFDSNYIINISTNLANTNGASIVKAEDILGYTVIYAHPYSNGKVDETITINLQDKWDYVLSYKQYTKSDAYTKDTGWYVIIEGYYSPDLYRLKLNLQLPYDAQNYFKVNNNGFQALEINSNDLQTLYSSVILNSQGKYVNSTHYIDRQNKLYHTNLNEYYIYLLQDQKVENMQIYDIYANGKDFNDSIGVELPNFEIPYYEMQYYYTFNDLSNVNLYEMAILDNEHKSQAKDKLTRLGAKNIIQVKDWKYSYCDSNETLNNKFALNVYWYRNIINIEINNLFESKDSFNGYALVIEYENVTTKLQDHTKYNLVIYTKNNDVYEYVTYSFNNIQLLQLSTKYQYKDLEQLFKTSTPESLLRLGITKQEGNILPIYFGNTFSVQAADQSKDHSLDEFVGYRFDNYSYRLTSEKCSDISELDNFANNGINYVVQINLQDYEHEYNGNTTNYFVDKDEVSVNVNFDQIEYVLSYQVTNNTNNVDDKYGTIEFTYKKDNIERYQFDYFTKIDNDSVLSSMIKVRLGSELLEWRLVNDIITSSKLSESQLCEILLNATFLRQKLYLNLSNQPASQYPSTAQQFIGYINAVCKDIDFEVKVNVKDLKENKVIREYILNDDETNALFSIQNTNQVNVNTVAIDNEYIIKMLSKKNNDNFLYYYQDGEQYVIRGLYIKYSLAHSTNVLVNEFDYPIENIDDIKMNVNNNLLEGTINYTQFIEVSPENRYLNFYVEISPIVNIQFEAKSNEYDKFKDYRQLSVGNEIVATALEGNPLTISGNYIGYWGQETLFNLVANDNYYSSATLNEYYLDEDLMATELIVKVNSNIKHTLSEDSKIVIELLPKLYNFDAIIEFNGVEFDANNFANIVNLSGINIFDINKGVEIKAYKHNIDPINGVYYYGDKLIINYTLNEVLKNDFTVSLYSNNSKLYYNYEQLAYVAQFNGKDIQLRILVLAKTDEITLSTNLPNSDMATIYAQINDGEIVLVKDKGSNEPYKSLTLVNGDKLNVYIHENVGFGFTGMYEYDNKQYEIEQTVGTGNYEQYIKITLFEEGFSLDKSGWYYLMFKQIPIDIQFKYYVVSPTIIEDVDGGNGYTASCDNNIIEENSIVTLTQGTDNIGYRFDGYSYIAPVGEDDSKQFELTTINESQVSFIIEGELLQYLSTVDIIDDKLPLVIYVNYVKQYNFDILYLCDEDEVIVNVKDKNGNNLTEGLYYDYGTVLSIAIQSVDIKHYKVSVELYNGRTTEIISNDTLDDVVLVEGSIISTNLGSLAGFVVNRQLVDNYVITINTIVERYNTVLNQNLYKQLGVSEDIPSINLQSKDNDYFEWHGIYYQVNATHEYATEVEIKIFVLKPLDKSKQYYTLDEVYLNDNKMSVAYDGEGVLNSMQGYYYSFKYRLIGDDLPTELKLDVNFKALYYVELK